MITVQIDTVTGDVCAVVHGLVTTPPPEGRTFMVCPDDTDTAGKRWNGSEFVTPVVPLRWDEFDFRKRFTRDERKAIMAAAKVSDDVADFEAMLQAAGRTKTMIVANDTLLNEAMDALVGVALLTAERKAEILGVVA